MPQNSIPEDDVLINSAVARKFAGGICSMTLFRWRRDGIIPEPVTIRGRNYWRRNGFLAAVSQGGLARTR